MCSFMYVCVVVIMYVIVFRFANVGDIFGVFFFDENQHKQLALRGGAKVTVAKVTDARQNELLLVEVSVDHRGDDLHLWEELLHLANAFWRRNQVEKHNVLFRNLVVTQNLDSTASRATSSKHWIKKKNLKRKKRIKKKHN